MKSFIKQLIVLAIAFSSLASRADQYAWNNYSLSTNALGQLALGSYVVSFCSQCDGQRAELWRIERTAITLTSADGFYQIQLFVRRLFQTREIFNEGDYREPTQWQTIPETENQTSLENIDLAYIYVRQAEGEFRPLAEVMGLKPLNCAVRTIRFPPVISGMLQKKQHPVSVK